MNSFYNLICQACIGIDHNGYTITVISFGHQTANVLKPNPIIIGVYWWWQAVSAGVILMNEVKVTQSCPTLCELMDYTDHGILQARILKWVAVPFSRGSSQPRDWTQVSHIAGGFFTSWAIKEAQWLFLYSTYHEKSLHFHALHSITKSFIQAWWESSFPSPSDT